MRRLQAYSSTLSPSAAASESSESPESPESSESSESTSSAPTAPTAAAASLGRGLGDGSTFKEVPMFGDYEKLGYYYTYVEIGAESDPQLFSLILDTGSALTVVPCKGCNNCGTHMDGQFDMARSSTAKYVECTDADCHGSCGQQKHCAFRISYSEGSSLSGDNIRDNVMVGGAGYHIKGVPFVFGCATVMTNLFRVRCVEFVASGGGRVGGMGWGGVVIIAIVAETARACCVWSRCVCVGIRWGGVV